MKYKGKKLSQPKPELVVIPRGDENIAFLCDAVLDYSDFDRLCPEPKPPVIVHRTKGRTTDANDPRYRQAINEHLERRSQWMVLTSLKATPDLEWETVNFDDPTTWANYEKELNTTFTNFEVHRIVRGVMTANSMDEDRMREARESFLQSQAQASVDSSSLPVEPMITPSGEPANDSVSVLPASMETGTV